MKINKSLAFLGAGIFMYSKYQKFIDFIRALKFSLNILKLDATTSEISINSLSAIKIPYKIEQIDLILNKKEWIATNKNLSSNALVVKQSNIPLVFNLLDTEVTEDILKKSEIAITYRFLGIIKERILYNPFVNENKGNNTSNTTIINSCGCKN